jgi:hypothetical protein
MPGSKEKPDRGLEDLVMMIPFYILVAVLIVVFGSMYFCK